MYVNSMLFASPNRLNFISATQGSPNGTLISGEVATYTATYTVQNADTASGGISNTASATSYYYENGEPKVDAIDQSDDGDDTDGNTENDPTLSYLGDFTSIRGYQNSHLHWICQWC